MDKEVFVILCFSVVVLGVFSCCIPDQYEGIQGISTTRIKRGKLFMVEGLYNISFDATNKKSVISGTIEVNGERFHQIVLQDFSTMPGKQYIVMKGKCIMSDLFRPFEDTCLKSAAKLKVSSYVGVGANKQMVNVYSDIVEGKMADITVTNDSCIPVTITRKNNRHIEVISYMGITNGIKDMSIFDVPEICL